jgi:Family of unknown function (DUF6464)
MFIEAESFTVANNKVVSAYLYNRCGRASHDFTPDTNKLKKLIRTIASAVSIADLIIECSFIGYQWNLSFIFRLNSDKSNQICITYLICIHELNFTNTTLMARIASDYILKKIGEIFYLRTREAYSAINEFSRAAGMTPGKFRSSVDEHSETIAFKEHSIHNDACKYFNGGNYLRCAVNPHGSCEGCQDYEHS